MGVCEFCCTHTDTLPCKSYGKIQYPSQDFCQFARGLNPYGYRDGMGRGGVAMEGVLQGIPGVMVLGILMVVVPAQIYMCERTTHTHTQRSAGKTENLGKLCGLYPCLFPGFDIALQVHKM